MFENPFPTLKGYRAVKPKPEATIASKKPEAKDALVEAKRAAITKLLARYDEMVAQAEKHRKEAQGLAMLKHAEAILNKADLAKAAKTAEEIESLMAEKGLDLSATAEKQSAILKARGLKIEFNPVESEISEKQLEAMAEVFGEGNLEPVLLPTLEQFDQKYLDALYSQEETADDKARGIINHHPSWWDKEAEEPFRSKDKETWGDVYIRSMRAELAKHSTSSANSVLLMESIQKPNYRSGELHYGSADGQDSTLDRLLPLFKEAFGETATRFNHSHDELVSQLLPKVKEKIIEKLKKHGQPIPKFQVILAPASAFNLQTVVNHPENSKTSIWEITSTVVLDKASEDSGHRLVVGSSANGGAGNVGRDRRGNRSGSLGVRLAVVLEK